jgi:hypothetical protein
MFKITYTVKPGTPTAETLLRKGTPSKMFQGAPNGNPLSIVIGPLSAPGVDAAVGGFFIDDDLESVLIERV